MTIPLAKYKALAGSADIAAEAIRAEIEKALEGQEAVDSLRNLQFIKSRLEEISRMLRQGTVVKDARLKGSMGRLVVDTWALKHPLGEDICQIECEFDRIHE